MNTVLQIAPLLVDYVPAPVLAAEFVRLSDLFEDPGWIRANGRFVRAVITNSVVGVPLDLWRELPNLGLIANIGAGLDKVDLDRARQRGVRVTYTPDILTDDVADLAIGLMLNLLRGIVEGHSFVRDGHWRNRPFTLGRSATGRRVGIVGFGRIGSAIAQRAEAFKMEIAYHGRRQQKNVAYTYFDDILGLASWADILVAAVPGGPENEKLFDARIFEALGSDGYFINVARGNVVDEQSLLAALHAGGIAGAGLDVFNAEPSINSEFFSAPHVVLSPHMGSATTHTRRAMADHAFANVCAYLSGLPLKDEVLPL